MSNQPSRRIRRGSIVVASTAALAIASAAFAASWTAESNGKAQAKSGRLEGVAASAAAPNEALFPGESADAALSLTNPNPVAMEVNAIQGNGPITSSSEDCDAAGHGVTFTDATGSWTIAKGATLDVSLPDAVHMALDSATECQDVTFSIPVRVTASVAGGGGGGNPTTTTTAPTYAHLRAAQNSEDYGDVALGQASDRTFTFTNIGDGAGSMSPQVVGPDFSLLNTTCGGTLPPNASCTITARFLPTSAGYRNGSVRLTVVSSGEAASVNVMGNGAYGPQLLSPMTAVFDYGTMTIGAQSAARTFVITNTGSSPTGTLRTILSGANPTEFSIVQNNCQGIALNPGQTCQLAVTFRAAGPGQRSATVNTSGAPGGSSTLTVRGSGVN